MRPHWADLWSVSMSLHCLQLPPSGVFITGSGSALTGSWEQCRFLFTNYCISVSWNNRPVHEAGLMSCILIMCSDAELSIEVRQLWGASIQLPFISVCRRLCWDQLPVCTLYWPGISSGPQASDLLLLLNPIHRGKHCLQYHSFHNNAVSFVCIYTMLHCTKLCDDYCSSFLKNLIAWCICSDSIRNARRLENVWKYRRFCNEAVKLFSQGCLLMRCFCDR